MSRLPHTISTSKHYTWEPGNGTRYEILVVDMTHLYYGHESAYMVVLNNFPKAMLISRDGGLLRYQDIMEATGLGEHDASVFTEMIAFATGRTPIPTNEDWYQEAVKTPFSAYMHGSD